MEFLVLNEGASGGPSLGSFPREWKHISVKASKINKTKKEKKKKEKQDSSDNSS